MLILWVKKIFLVLYDLLGITQCFPRVTSGAQLSRQIVGTRKGGRVLPENVFLRDLAINDLEPCLFRPFLLNGKI